MRNSESERKTQDDAEVIADRLHSAAIHLLRRLRREDATSGLSAPRLSALSVIVFGGPLTLHTSKGNTVISRQLGEQIHVST